MGSAIFHQRRESERSGSSSFCCWKEQKLVPIKTNVPSDEIAELTEEQIYDEYSRLFKGVIDLCIEEEFTQNQLFPEPAPKVTFSLFFSHQEHEFRFKCEFRSVLHTGKGAWSVFCAFRERGFCEHDMARDCQRNASIL